ncbi:hypothetical protein Gohar_018513 [Gossypium harknessii]|uniref:CASP-like protein n=1 Tax=Gossypium harknessii TaxID=34285 RepID=A0A7J9G9D0_9ROSI|nr:hypothetical protein [Gossypium harknessii]
MMNGHKTEPAPPPPPPSATPRQLTEAKVMAEENGRQGEPCVRSKTGGTLTKGDVVVLTLRLLCMATAVTAMSFMVTARQVSAASFYGFQLQLHSKWSFSYSFDDCNSLLFAPITHCRLKATSEEISSDSLKKSSMACLCWRSASGVANLNRTGIRHTALPNFCKSLDSFCDHVTVSIAFTFFSCVMYAAAAVQDVIWLSTH